MTAVSAPARSRVKPLLTIAMALILGKCVLDQNELRAQADAAAAARAAMSPAAQAAASAAQAAAEQRRAADERDFQDAVLKVRAVRTGLHDPSSFQLESLVLMPNGALCLAYRARNGFGALRLGHYVITRTVVVDTPAAWNKTCDGRTGTDLSHVRHALG